MLRLSSQRILPRPCLPLAAIPLLLLANVPSHAGHQVTLILTQNGQLAMKAASWLIFDAKDPAKPITSFSRHTGAVELPLGRYIVHVNSGGKFKEATFVVDESDAEKRVNVSLD